MAKKLNKPLVGALVLSLMVAMTVGGIVMVHNLPDKDPTVYAEEAKRLEGEGAFDRAMQTYQRAYGIDEGRNPEYLVSAARCGLEAGYLRDALGCLNQALIDDPTLVSAHEETLKLRLELAKLFPSTQYWQQLLDSATAASAIPAMKDKAITQCALGLAYLNLRGSDSTFADKGQSALRRAFELDPSNKETIQAMVLDLWRSAKEKELKREFDDAKGDQQAAKDLLAASLAESRASGSDVDVAELEFVGAQLDLANKDVASGMQTLERLADGGLLGTRPHIALANLFLGRVSTEVPRDLKAAEAILKKGLDLESDDGQVYIMLGMTYKIGRQLAEDSAERDSYKEKEYAIYERGLENVERSKHFRDYLKKNQARVEMLRELFMLEVGDAFAAAGDDAAKSEAIDAAEHILARVKEEIPEGSQEVRFLQANLYNVNGDIVLATREAEAAVKADDKRVNVALMRLLADLYSRQGLWGKVEESLTKAIQATGPDATLYVPMAQVLFQQNRLTEALRFLRPDSPDSLRATLENDPAAIRLRMQIYNALEQPQLAQKESERLGSTGSVDGEIAQITMELWAEDYDKAEQLALAMLEKHPDDPKVFQAMIEVLDRAGRKDKARELVLERLGQNPDDRNLKRMSIALAPESDERDQKQLAFINEVEDPFERNIALANFYFRKNDVDGARAALDEAESIKPDSTGVIEQQLMFSLQSKDWDRADRYVAKFRTLDIDGAHGKFAEGRLALARGQDMLSKDLPGGVDEVRKSADLIRDGLEIYPSNSNARMLLAQAKLILGDRNEAIQVLEQALELNPANGQAARMRSQLAYEDDDIGLARRYLLVAEKNIPDDSWVKEMRQRLQERENPAEGIAGREERRKANPDDVSNIRVLARLYSDPSVGEFSKAEAAYRDALEKAPDDIGLVREVAQFLASDDVNLPQEAESLFRNLLTSTTDMEKKAVVAALMGEFYVELDRFSTADRYYRMALEFDSSPRMMSSAADFYRRTHNYERSVELLDQLLSTDGLETDMRRSALSRKVAALLSLNELDRARGAIDEFMAAFPDDDQGMIYEGAWHRVAGDIKKAEAAFDRHLSRDPGNAVALWQRGQLYLLQGKFQLAIADLKQAKGINPSGFGYQHRIALADALIEVKQYDQAIEELNEILSEDPSQTRVSEALIDAYTRVVPPRYQAAEDLIYRNMRQYPRDYRWPMLLGELGKLGHDLRKRVTGYQKAVELSQFQPDAVREFMSALRAADLPAQLIEESQKIPPASFDRSPAAISDLAWAYARMDRAEEASATFDRALAAAGENFQAYSAVVFDLVRILGNAPALSQIETASNADPSNLYKRRALVHLYWLNNRIPDAINLCNEIERTGLRDNDLLFARLARGMLCAAQQDHQGAIESYEAALQIDPNQPTVLNNLAYLLGETLDRPVEALPYARKAAKLTPNDSNTLDTFGWMEFKNEMYGEAAGTLMRALDLDGRNMDALIHLGYVHLARKECPEARRRFEYAKSLITDQLKALESQKADSPAGEKQALEGQLPKIDEGLDRVTRECGPA